jgi:hypothetical protein
MTDLADPIETIVALSVEGARRYGDDPRAIADFIEGEISRRSEAERRRLRQGLALLTENATFQTRKS